MRIINGLEKIDKPLVRPVVTVGNFDGVHRGHQALLAKVRQRADLTDGVRAAVTFEPHPVMVLKPEMSPTMLVLKEDKEELIARQGMDVLIHIHFTREFASLAARQFFRDILMDKLGMTELVYGYDSAFGRDRVGGAEFIDPLAAELGFIAHSVPAVTVGGRPISSTWAREMIQAGQVDQAIELLGRPYFIKGTVVSGAARGGRILGFPTANVNPGNQVVPARGVYAVRVHLDDGRVCKGVTNVGVNPTFGDNQLSVETFVLDFDEDLYGRRIKIDMITRLRDEKKFDSADQLAAQIGCDAARAREELV